MRAISKKVTNINWRNQGKTRKYPLEFLKLNCYSLFNFNIDKKRFLSFILC